LFTYTICFIRQEDRLLLLNRFKAPNMGLWNGIGGKIEQGETLLQSIAREIYEETGLAIPENVIDFGGVVRWVSESFDSGMYLFYCELPPQIELQSPKLMDEGILMWYSIDWVLDKENEGVAHNIKYFLPHLLKGEYGLQHLFTYNDEDQLLSYEYQVLEKDQMIHV